MQQLETTISHHGLEHLGIATPRLVRWNLQPTALGGRARSGRGHAGGRRRPVRDDRPAHRAQPDDRFIVDEPGVRDTIDWGKVNKPIAAAHAGRLWAKARAHVADLELFVQDVHVGAAPEHRRRVRVVTENAWHSLFARNMFRECPQEELADFEPDFTVLQLPSLKANPVTDSPAPTWRSCSILRRGAC